MMCAKLLRPDAEHAEGEADKPDDWFDKLIAGYGRSLEWVLQRQALTMLVFFATVALTVALYIVIPKGFFPIQDTGIIQGISEAPQNVSFSAMAEYQQKLAQADS